MEEKHTDKVDSNVVHIVDSIICYLELFDIAFQGKSLASCWFTVMQCTPIDYQLTTTCFLIIIVDSDAHCSTRLSSAANIVYQ